MPVNYRAIDQNDVPEVLRIFEKLNGENAEVSFAELLIEDQIRQMIIEESTFIYIAEENDRVLAVIRATKEKSNSQAVILTIAVEDLYRGRSVGKNLTLFCLDQLLHQGIHIARAYIYSDNYSSINTILSCGFVTAGSVHQHHYSERQKRYVDDLIFHKVLGLNHGI